MDRRGWVGPGGYSRFLIGQLEAENKELKKEIEALQDQVPHPGDGACDRCGAIPSVDIPTSLCTDCLDVLGELFNHQTGEG